MGYALNIREPLSPDSGTAASKANVTQWPCSIWEMATLRRLMTAAGVLADDVAPLLTRQFERVAAKEANDARESTLNALLSQRSAQPDKVPAYKFESSEGWVVDPEECQIVNEGLCEFANPFTDQPAPSSVRSGHVCPAQEAGSKHVDISAMLRVLKALGEGAILTELEDDVLRFVSDTAGAAMGPDQMPSIAGTVSEDPTVAAEQVIEATKWTWTCLAFAQFNFHAAEHGGYTVDSTAAPDVHR